MPAAADGSGGTVQRDQIQLPKSSSGRATISGMSCGACANKVQGTMANLPTIEKAKVEVGFADFTVKDDMSYASLAKGVENGKFKIEDLSWTAPKPVVAEAAVKMSKGECPYANPEACKDAKGECPHANPEACKAAKAAGKSGECCSKSKAQPKP